MIRFTRRYGSACALLALSAGAMLGAAPSHAQAQNLYVSDFDNSQILEYNAGGAVARTFSSGGAFINPNGIAFFGGSMYVSAADPNTGDGGVYRYDLSNPGAAPTLFAPDMGGTLSGLAFGSGNLYAADSQQGEILEFDGTTGALLNTFGSGSLVSPAGLAFDGGALYVSDNGAGDIVTFNASGTSEQTFVSAGAGGLQSPGFLAFDAQGSLDVTSGQGAATTQNPSGSGTILRFNGPGSGTPGAFQSVFASDAGLNDPYGLALDSSGTVFVGDRNSNGNMSSSGSSGGHFDRFTADGAFQQSVAFAGGNGNPYGLAFGPASAPEPGGTLILSIGAALVGLRLTLRRRA